jgi:hypothetical protein
VKEFVIDAARGVVHHATAARPECGLDEIPEGARQERASQLEATMVMKTRHYRACPHCYQHG